MEGSEARKTRVLESSLRMYNTEKRYGNTVTASSMVSTPRDGIRVENALNMLSK